MLLSNGNILFSVGPLYMGLISTLFNCAGSRNSPNLPLALSTNTKAVALLQHPVASKRCYYVLLLQPL